MRKLSEFNTFHKDNYLRRYYLKGDRLDQIVSSTRDGNVEFVHSQYSCILRQQLYVSNKIINNSDNKVVILQ